MDDAAIEAALTGILNRLEAIEGRLQDKQILADVTSLIRESEARVEAMCEACTQHLARVDAAAHAMTDDLTSMIAEKVGELHDKTDTISDRVSDELITAHNQRKEAEDARKAAEAALDEARAARAARDAQQQVSLVEHVVEVTEREDGNFDVLIDHPVLQERIPFFAQADDPEPAGRELFAALSEAARRSKPKEG